MEHSKLYGLSSCFYCKQCKELLESRNVSFDEVLVDMLPPDERKEALRALKKVNPRASFPTIVFANGTVIVGYKPAQIKEALLP